METYQIFLVPISNNKTTEEPDIQARNYSVTTYIKGKRVRNDLDDEKATNNSEPPSDKIEEKRVVQLHQFLE